jgi:hypothetical protein
MAEAEHFNALKALAEAAAKAQLAEGNQLNTDSHSTFLLGEALDSLNNKWIDKLNVIHGEIKTEANNGDSKDVKAAKLQELTNKYQAANTQMQVETNIIDGSSKAASQQAAQDTSNAQGLNTLASSANSVGSYFANIEQQTYS